MKLGLLHKPLNLDERNQHISHVQVFSATKQPHPVMSWPLSKAVNIIPLLRPCWDFTGLGPSNGHPKNCSSSTYRDIVIVLSCAVCCRVAKSSKSISESLARSRSTMFHGGDGMSSIHETHASSIMSIYVDGGNDMMNHGSCFEKPTFETQLHQRVVHFTPNQKKTVKMH